MKRGTGGRQAARSAITASTLIAALAPTAVEAVARVRLGGDAETVHALRVALARLRVAFWLFPDAVAIGRATALDAELKWLRRLCSPLRDWDVFVAACRRLAPLDDAPRAMAALLELAAAERSQSLATIHERLDGPRCRRLLKDLRALGESTVQASIAVDDGAVLTRAARARLQPLLAKACRRGRRIDELGASRLHRLRIRLRRPRYACELLREQGEVTFGEATRKALARLHTRLGAIQDRVIGERLLARFRERDDEALAPAIRALRAQLRRNAKRRRRQLVAAWRAVEATPMFQQASRGCAA